jgi:hypothetical protein
MSLVHVSGPAHIKPYRHAAAIRSARRMTRRLSLKNVTLPTTCCILPTLC